MTRGAESCLRDSLRAARAAHTGASKLSDLATGAERLRAERLRLQAWRLVEALSEEVRACVASEFVAVRREENAAEVGT